MEYGYQKFNHHLEDGLIDVGAATKDLSEKAQMSGAKKEIQGRIQEAGVKDIENEWKTTTKVFPCQEYFISGTCQYHSVTRSKPYLFLEP